MLAVVTSDPLADIVSAQYERWIYPAPIEDLPAWLESSWQWFDPSHAHRLMWPDREYREGMDILVAGCGTNQAAVIAFTNPTAHVVAIDVSTASLAHHRRLADTNGLDNLELHRLPIEELDTLGRDFDLIISTGVLHHMEDPARGMAALADRLRPDGVLALMLYANYGRFGVHLLQSVFRDLGLEQDDDSLLIVRDALDHVGPAHPIRSYLQIAPDLDDDAGLVDTFLHGRERAYTIDECRDLVANAGLAFQDVFLKASYYPPVMSPSPFLSAVARLPRERQWAVMQRINSANACHYFLACRPERARETYAIDFTSGDPLDYVPSFRKGCYLKGNTVHRHDWSVDLSALQAALVESIDGHRSIRQITDRLAASGSFARSPADEVTATSLATFQALWQTDIVALGIPEGATAG